MKFLIRRLLKEAEEEQYYKISASEYVELMKLSGYHSNVTKIKKFGGKPLWIVGNVALNNTPIDSLGNVAKIDGSLDISHTKVSDISGIEVKGHVWDSDTPIERKRIAAELRERLGKAQIRRESNEWDLEDTDDEGIRANALYKHLVEDGDIEELTDEEREELNSLKSELEIAQNRYNELEDHDDDLSNEISIMEQRIEELENMDNDVYVISPFNYRTNGMYTFEVIGIPGLRGNEYFVGNEYEMDRGLKYYVENYIDEVGVQNFSRHILEDSIDNDYLESYLTDILDSDVRDNPDVYFSDDDYKLTDEQEKRIEDIESEIEDYENQQAELDNKIEDPEEYSLLYDDFQKLIDELEEEKDRIVPDTEPTEEMIEDKIQSRIHDALYDPIETIRDWGLDIENFVDKKELAKWLVNSEGYEMMSGYDGYVNTTSLDDETYYIIRNN